MLSRLSNTLCCFYQLIQKQSQFYLHPYSMLFYSVSSFSNHVFATNNNFLSQNFSHLLSSTVLSANSISIMYHLKTINLSTNVPVEVSQTKNHFTMVLQTPLTCHLIIKLIFLTADLPARNPYAKMFEIFLNAT